MTTNKFIISPDDFARLMTELVENYQDDEEALHMEMDELMMLTLEALGYEEGVKIFNNTDKLYS